MDLVLYDADCSLCTRVKTTIEALDWLDSMRFVPNTDPEARRFGIPREHLDHQIYLVHGDQPHGGYAACQQIAMRLPISWMVAAYVVARRPWTALLFAFLLSPLARPVGQPAYDWVARNRYRLPGSTCDNQIK